MELLVPLIGLPLTILACFYFDGHPRVVHLKDRPSCVVIDREIYCKEKP